MRPATCFARQWRLVSSARSSAARCYSSSFPVPPAASEKHHVHTTLNYFKPLPRGQSPPTVYPFRPEKHDYSPWAEKVPVTIHDVAGDELKYSLDEHGFKFHFHRTEVTNFGDPDVVKREYFPEMETLMKQVTGAKHVFLFNPIHRKPPTEPGKAVQGPVQLVHNDLTPQDAVAGARHDLGPQADELLKGRFQVIHAWRPLKPVYKDPFAVADSRSVADEDLVHTKVVFPFREGSTFNVTASPKHRFYYRYGQTPDIVTLFKSYDSETGVARRNPHSAFVDPATVDHPGRESFEIRAYVFHEPR
ncbi:Hydroxylase/desaturase asaB [Colletotrichum spinosum]|uniref:Hydroxylase/desaturase asaB n=1 Tax=Colletotrichum spinosum TaxID=1347390 RepID=A0A4R8Q343_9PEZI|nr:Hydroxylase/desaturase asaB [Colletotrichum spinosum]